MRALDGVSLSVEAGETVAVVGESGCGKTTLARGILGLQRLSSGTVRLHSDGEKVNGSTLAERIGMVWQDPYASLDPRWKVSRIIEEPGRIAGKAVDVSAILEEVGLSPETGDRYPHQMSGGQRQRVAIGRALALRPPLVVCDEPTAALDLSIQAQILNLLRDIQESRKCSILYISHDLTTVRFLADRVAVMYLGKIVEVGTTSSVFSNPMHPYTKALLDSAPSLERLGYLPEPAKGEVPDPSERIDGCRYAPRCPRAIEPCRKGEPQWVSVEDHFAMCNVPLTVGTPPPSDS